MQKFKTYYNFPILTLQPWCVNLKLYDYQGSDYNENIEI